MRYAFLPLLCVLAATPVAAQQYQQELQEQQNTEIMDTLDAQANAPQQNITVNTDVLDPAAINQPQNPVIPAPTTPTPEMEEFKAPPVQWEKQKYAVLQTLDKVTARTATVTLPINKASAVGPLFIEVKTCQKTPPTEQPEATAFLQIWEAKPKTATADDRTQSQWVFSGWMFMSSPALSAMNHPVYDVWVKDCTNELTPAK